MKLHRLLALALTAPLLAAPASSGIRVLCFGSDGHVAVESASSDLCCREWEASCQGARDERLATSVRSASEPCCDDLQLSVESAALTTAPHKAPPPSAILAALLVPGLPRPACVASLFPLSTESPVAASLRTVVLRA